MVKTPRRRLQIAVSLLIAILGLAQCVTAQEVLGANPEPAQHGAEGQPGLWLDDEITGELLSTPPGVFSVGISTGFPSYQTVALTAAIQAQYVGLQLKGSWTAAGPFLAGQLRAYPPVPIPMPVYVGVGGGVYGGNTSFHVVVGGHVPLGKNLRFDLEGGVANVPVLSERAWAPHLAAGLSYAFPVEFGSSQEGNPDVAPATRRETIAGPTCASPRDPDSGLLRAAVDRAVADWLTSAQATFGSVYKDLSYSYRISSTTISGVEAKVTVQYSGSVTEILTGERQSATGTAKATYVWNGCAWRDGQVEY